MPRFLSLFVCVAGLLLSGLPASAQSNKSEFQVLAQIGGAPKRALPVPNKPVNEDEIARAARINNWTVGVAGGLLEGTFSKYAADLGKALDDSDNLRVLPIITYGAVGNVTDLIYLKGVDFAITYADVLDHFKNVEKISAASSDASTTSSRCSRARCTSTRAPRSRRIKDLAGKKVGFNTVGSAANYTGDIVFKRIGIQVEQVFQNNALAIEAMRRGELAAIVHVVGKPNDLFSKLKPEPGFHFLPIEYGDKFSDYYVPAELTSADYPNLIPPGQSVDTISVSALLAVYNWKSDTDRYRRCVRFIEYLFNRFDKLRENPYQPGWRQINLAGTIPGWTRYPTDPGADRQGVRRRPPRLDSGLARQQAARAAPNSVAEQERLFREFLEWSKQQKR